MKKIFWMMILNAAFSFIAEAQNFEWAKRAGLWAYDYGYGITTDNAGNIYVSGKYEMNANFGGTTVGCQGNHDIYVAKYSPSGNLIWIRTAGGYTGDYATAVAVDDNYVYIAGEIEGVNAKIYFSNSSITLTCKASNDIFLAKYDLSGNLLWARSAGDYYYEKALGIAYDNAGNVYICGLFNNKAVFGGSTTLTGYGENDIFIAKYDASGNFLWAKKAGGSGRDEAKGIVVDGSGNVYISGMFKGTANFSGITKTSNGYFDMFLAKYSTHGDLQWVKTAGAVWDDVAWSVTMDNAGKIYIAGEFNASVNFGGTTLTTSGSTDIFVACYNSSGNLQWAKRAGGNSADRARGIGTDGNNIFITGQFGGSASFGSFTKNAADGSDIFFAALNNSGNFLWASAAGGPADAPEDLGYESGIAITAESNGNVYATGAMLNGGTFGSTTLNAYSRTDIFIAKLKNGSGGTTSGSELIASNSSWKYLDNGSNQGTAWRTASYNDGAWKTGNAELGYGDGDEATVVSYGPSSSNKYITTYFRKTFNVTNASTVSGLELSLIRDDGAVVYINGFEVHRNNMPSETINYNTLASSSATSSESIYQVSNISASSLVNGTNLIAVEMHQHTASSSDLSFNLKLRTLNGSGGGTSGTELIAANSSWKYLDNGSNQAASWQIISFNDGSWKSGNAELGYGDGDEATIVSYGNNSNNKFITTYFRKTFNVNNASTISGLEISLIRDDGAVVYINGSEVHRNNMPSGTINYNTLASSSATSTESVWQVANTNSSSLINGTNLIAVEMHQHKASSSDLSFNLKLRTLSGAKKEVEEPDTSKYTELIAFNGQEKGNNIFLVWTTAREVNNEYFIVERSVDEDFFEPLGIITGAGNSGNEQNYLFIDSILFDLKREGNKEFFYRLNLTDYDGIAAYSPTIAVATEPLSSGFSISNLPLSVNIYPNPVKHSFTILLSEMGNSPLTLLIHDITGKRIFETNILKSQSEIDVSSFIPGVYMVGLKSDEDVIFIEKIVVQQ